MSKGGSPLKFLGTALFVGIGIYLLKSAKKGNQ
jgi:hypothetical protein